MPKLASRQTSRRRVLIVEDESGICELLTELVVEAGLEPLCVQCDARAYAALRDDPDFSCMIVDVNLGAGTTGYDVARFARKLAPDLPVIYVSGQSSEDSFRTNGVAGSLFIAKPFTPAEVSERLRMLVGDNDDRAE